jgi:hypothetical protein
VWLLSIYDSDIPVSDAEKKWLFNYFYSMGEDIEKGNYYRYVL